MLLIQNLSFHHDRAIFRDLNLEIRRGDFIHLKGPNGAGKTSLLRALAGLIPEIYPGCLEGTIRYEGKSIPQEGKIREICLTGPWAASRLFCKTVLEEVTFSSGADPQEAQRLLAYFRMDDLAERHPQTLSGGQQQLVLLTAYLCCRPKIILLDECFAQLSEPHKERLVSCLIELNRQGKTIILVEHILPQRLQDHVIPIELTIPKIAASQTKRMEQKIIPFPRESSRGKSSTTLLMVKGLKTAQVYPFAKEYTDLAVCPREMIHIKGEIGSGKTTFFRMLLGLIPYRGEIQIQDKLLKEFSRKERARMIGVVLQSPDSQFFCPTVEKEILYSARKMKCHDPGYSEKIFRILNLQSRKDQNPFTLSHGEKKKCQLASSLMLKPPILILDEPDAGMDQESQRQLVRLFTTHREAGGAILFTSHSKEFLTLLQQEALPVRPYDLQEGTS